MKIQNIYEQYKIMPSLQLHMLRVTAVAKLICESTNAKVNKQNIIKACLLHDMGNILKFNLDVFPEFLQPEGKEYWQKVKDDFEQKYGKNEHEATILIAKEIGVEKRVLELIDAFQFSLAKENAELQDMDRMICAYSDMRVKPSEVVSMEERLLDGRKRFKLNKKHLEEDENFFNTMTSYLERIEKEIFLKTSITPSDITEVIVTPYIEKLRDIELLISK
jgi:hypothetical protein